jgi:hypothetical protein
MIRQRGSLRTGIVLLAGLCAWHALAGYAFAADSSEFWPELNAFVPMSPGTRIFLDAAFAEGKESDVQSLDLAVFLDVSLKPITRKELWTEDWQRSRYFWARVGYDRIFKETSETGADVAEDRGIVSLYGKAPLPAQVWLEARARADLRWIGDDYSTRYRARLEVTREFMVLRRPVVPYVNYEWFYDTRYDGWARTLWAVGAEVTRNKHLRFEAYLSGQNDRLPEEASLAAFGVLAKWYF